MHIALCSLLEGDMFLVQLSTPLLQEKISHSKHNLKPNIYLLFQSCFNSSKINTLPVISGTSPYNTQPETWPKWVKLNLGTLMQIFVENKIQIFTSDPENYCMVDLQSLFIIFICIAFSRSRYNDLVTTSLWNTHWEIWGWYSLSFESRIKGKHITQRLKSFLEVALSQIRRSLSLVKY